MTSFPKPPIRAPKVQRPIPRKARVKKRRGTKRAALVRACDKLWSEIIRAKGYCVLSLSEPTHECKRVLQAMHGISRRYHGTRWNLSNGYPGCQAAHYRFTKDPMAWTRWLIERWGLGGYDLLWGVAQAGKPRDMAAVLSALQARKALEGP